MNFHLQNVYSDLFTAKLNLWRLLQERRPEVNISHKVMPTWEEHCKFIESNPYKSWFLIIDQNEVVGAIYVSKSDEIGIFIYEACQGKGYGKRAVKLLKGLHQGRLLANIAPGNYKSKAMFMSLGFKLLQETYCLDEQESMRQ